MTTSRYCLHCKAVFRTSYQRCPIDGHQLLEGEEEPLIGQVLDGRYRVQACVGHGAMGRVYRAQHVRMGRSFAVKVMYGDLAADPDMRARFMREAEAASRLDHPNVVAAVDVGATDGGIPYIVMEFLEGQTLKRWVDVEGPLSEADMVWVGVSVARGLAHAHLRGLVHRDLKPENIFIVDIDGRRLAKILDFGIAFLADHGTNAARLTQTGHIMGTPYFMPPEQCSGQPVDARADIFSLGLCLFYGLVGSPPFSGDAALVIHRIVSTPVPPLDSVVPPDRVTTHFSRVVAKMTAHDREHRYQTAEACVAVLEGRDPSDTPLPAASPAKRGEVDPTEISDMGIPGPGSEPSFLPAPPPRRPTSRGLGRYVLPILIGVGVGMFAFAGRFLITPRAPIAEGLRPDSGLEPAPLVEVPPKEEPPQPVSVTPPALEAKSPEPTPGRTSVAPKAGPRTTTTKSRGRRGRARRPTARGASAATRRRTPKAAETAPQANPSPKKVSSGSVLGEAAKPEASAPSEASSPGSLEGTASEGAEAPPPTEVPSPSTGGPAPSTGGPAPSTGGPAPSTGGPAPSTANPPVSAEPSEEAAPSESSGASSTPPDQGASPDEGSTSGEGSSPAEGPSPEGGAPPSEDETAPPAEAAPSEEETPPPAEKSPPTEETPPSSEAGSAESEEEGPADPKVGPKRFSALYARVKKRLEGLAQTKGEAAAAPLRERYLAIDKAQALANPEVRKTAYADLQDIQLDLAATEALD